jgi:hypothetical protein
MGDQKYLDEWPQRYSNCHIIQHKGAGIAPWNYSQYEFTADPDGQVRVDRVPLIFYHFHQFQVLGGGKFNRLSQFYTEECPEPAIVYKAYERAMSSTIRDVQAIERDFAHGFNPSSRITARRLAQRYLPRIIKDAAKRFVRY